MLIAGCDVFPGATICVGPPGSSVDRTLPGPGPSVREPGPRLPFPHCREPDPSGVALPGIVESNMAARRFNPRLAILVVLLLVGAVCGVWVLHRFQVRRNAAALLATVDESVAAGNPAEAINPLRKYVTLRPADEGRYLQLAGILADRAFSGVRVPEDWAFTKDVLRTAVTRDPEQDALREKLVVLLLEADEIEAAMFHAAALRKRSDPVKDPEAFGRYGMLYVQAAMKAGKPDEVEQTLVELTNVVPGTPLPPERMDAFMLLAAIQSEGRSQWQAAEEVLGRMVAVFPESSRAWKVYAGWSRRNGKIDQAAEAIAKARALAPDDEEAILIAATVALAQGKPDQAEALLASIPTDAPLTESLVMARAELARVRGDNDAMIGILRAGVEALPTSKPLMSEWIVFLADSGRIEEVRSSLVEGRKALPEDAPAILYGEATVAMAEGRWSQALAIWERLGAMVSSDPSLARRVDIARANCHDALGDTLRAAEARRRVAAGAPGSELAKFLEATDLEQAGRPDEAIEIIEKLAAGLPREKLVTRPEIWRTLLRMRQAAQLRRPADERDWTEIDAFVEDLIGDGGLPPDAAARIRIDVLSARGDLEAALVAAEAAVAAYPDDLQFFNQLVGLLAAAKRGDEAWARIDAASEALRTQPAFLGAEIDVLTRTNRGTWGERVDDIDRRVMALSGPGARDVKGQWMAFQIGLGADEAARTLAESILAEDPDDVRLRLLLLAVSAESDDAKAVAEQAASIEKRFGSDTAISRVARAVQGIIEVRAARLAGGDADSLSEAEKKTLAAARKLLDQAVAERPDWDAPPRFMASIAELEGDRGAAIGYLRRAILGGEPLPFARRRLIVMLVATDRFDEAAPVIASLGEFGGPAVDRIRADFLAATGRNDEALRLAASLTENEPENAKQLLWHAGLLTRCGWSEEADAMYRKAIVAAPQTPAPYLGLLRLQVQRNLDGDALATRDGALQALEGAAKDRFRMIAAELLGNGTELEAGYREAVAADGNDLEAARRLVEQCQVSGRLKEARRELQRIVGLEAAKGTPTLVWARRRLAEQMALGGSYPEFQQAIALLALNLDEGGKQSEDDMALEATLLLRRNDPSSWRRGLQVLELLGERRPLKVGEKVMREKARATLVPSLRPQSIRNLGEVALSANGSTAMFAMLVEMCLDDGDIPAAEDWLAKLLEVAPNGALTLRLVAKVALVKGDSETVAGVLKTLLPDVPVTEANASRMVPAARVVEDLGFPEEAGRVFAKCAELSTDGVLLHAQSLGRRHRTKEAIALAESVRAEVSPQSFLDTLLAISRYSDADPDSDAVDDIERIAGSLRRENPGVPGVAFSAAVLEDAFGRTSRAMKGYRDLLASTDVEAGLRAVISANLAFDIAHPETADEATKLIDAAVAEMGPTTDLLDSRSMVRLARGQTRQALEDVSDAILLQPSPRNLLHLALIRTEMSDLDGAREALAEAERKGLAEERLSPDDRRRLAKVEAAIEGKK